MKPGVVFEVSGCGVEKNSGMVDSLIQDIAGFSIQDEMRAAIFNNPKDDYNFYQVNQRTPRASNWGVNSYVMHKNVTQFNLNIGIPWKVNTLGEKWKFNGDYIPSQAITFTNRGFNTSDTAVYNELYQLILNNDNITSHNDNVRNVNLLKLSSSFFNINKEKVYICEQERNLSDADHMYIFKGQPYRTDNWLLFVIKKIGGNKGYINYGKSDTNKLTIFKEQPVALNNRIDIMSYGAISSTYKYNDKIESLYNDFKNYSYWDKNKNNYQERLRVNYYKINPQSTNSYYSNRFWGGGREF